MVGVVLIAVMVVAGVNTFMDNASSANRDALVNDLSNFAAAAQKFYRKPSHFGGGSHSFSGLRLQNITKNSSNANGQFVLVPEPASASDVFVTITATGKEAGLDRTNPVQVQVDIWADSLRVQTLN
jgi:hypothetical protein